jgi:hypothetical protein
MRLKNARALHPEQGLTRGARGPRFNQLKWISPPSHCGKATRFRCFVTCAEPFHIGASQVSKCERRNVAAQHCRSRYPEANSISKKKTKYLVADKLRRLFAWRSFYHWQSAPENLNADGAAATALAGKPLRREVHRGRRPASPKIAATGTRPSRASELLLGFSA